MKKWLTIKNKILIVLSILPLLSIGLVVLMATATFKDDKITYVYNSVLSSAQAKSSSASAQLQSFIQNLRALTVNYDPDKRKMSPNGRRFIESEQRMKVFFDHKWDGEKFQLRFQSAKEDEYLEDELQEVAAVLSEAWHKKLVIQPLVSRPFHLLVSARVGDTANINSIVLESPDFFSLFTGSVQGQAFLYNKNRGFLIGDSEQKDLSSYLVEAVFSKDLFEMTSETVIDGRESLVSLAKTAVADLYVVSTVDRSKALAALYTLIRRAILFTLCLLSLLVVVGVFASNGLVSPLRSLMAATGKVMEGDFTVRVPTKGGDEIGKLALNFNKMTDEVSRLMERTAESARMESELKTAKTVQNILFPQSDAEFGQVKMYGFSEPASECGGDWWYYSRSGSKIYVWIGDATGHGVPAALLTSAVRAVASVIEGYESFKPSEAMKMLNSAIYATSKGQMMMTFFIGCIDLEEGTLTYSNASHDPPYYLAKDSRDKPKRKDFFPLMEVNSPRLGEQKNSKFKDHTMKIDIGDKFIFYTDGIFDVRNEGGEIWGERRFLRSLSTINSEEAQDTVKNIFKTIGEFRMETPLDDDVTLVVVEYGQRNAA